MKPCLLVMLIFSLSFLPPMPEVKAEANLDAARGYSYLVNSGYIGCGVPVTVMKRALISKNLVPEPVVAAFVPMAGEKIFNSPTRLPGRNPDNESVTPSMNVFTTKRGVKAMNYNCLSCHGEYIDGTFIVGLGNRTRDFTQDVSRFAKVLPLLAWTEAEREELKAFQRGTFAIAPYTKPYTVGVNPAVNLTYALFAQRSSETYEWTDAPFIDPPATEFPPVDVPPWWRMGRKSTMFYNGEFTKSHHRIMTLASILCVESKEEILALDQPFRDVEAFVKSLKAPPYPLPIQKDLAREGQKVFEGNCKQCHGSYGEGGYYPEIFVPIDQIGTDPMLMEQQTGPETERFRKWGDDASFMLYGESFSAEGKRGYLAPPLDGIWATAPFFHNGSVPNLEGVLDSSKRPLYWWKHDTHNNDDYDMKAIGVKFDSISYGYHQGLPFVKRYIYDTTLPGYGNGGHEFGDVLTPQERKAVIEYLKTL